MCVALMSPDKNKDQEEASKSREIFENFLLGELVSLKNDRVINVRMFLSEALANHHKKYKDKSLIKELKSLKRLVKELLNDKNRDVREPLLIMSDEDLNIED